MKTLREYYDMFGVMPPLPYSFDYEDEMMQDKMKKAIKEKKPLTLDSFDDIRQEGAYDKIDK